MVTRHILQPADLAEARNEIHHALAQQRFTAGYANLANPQAHQDAAEAQEFLPGQQVAVREIVLRIGRLAVDATEVAAVRHRNAQVVNFAPEFIVHKRRDRVQGTLIASRVKRFPYCPSTRRQNDTPTRVWRRHSPSQTREATQFLVRYPMGPPSRGFHVPSASRAGTTPSS